MVLGKEAKGKGEEKKPDGMTTRTAGSGGAGSRSPKTPSLGGLSPGKPSTDLVKQADIQRIIDKLDGLDERIEFSTNQLTDKIEASSARTNKLEEDCVEVKKVTKGLRTQLSIHGTRITDVEDKIES